MSRVAAESVLAAAVAKSQELGVKVTSPIWLCLKMSSADEYHCGGQWGKLGGLSQVNCNSEDTFMASVGLSLVSRLQQTTSNSHIFNFQ